MEKLCKTHRIPVDPRARGKGNSLAAQGKGKRENRIFPLVENQPFFPIFDQKTAFPQGKRCGKDGRKKKSKPFFQNGSSLPDRLGRGEGFPKGFPHVFHRFSQGESTGRAPRIPCAARRDRVFPSFHRLYFYYCYFTVYTVFPLPLRGKRASVKRTEKLFGIFRGEESAKTETSRPKGGENALFLMNVLKG